MTHSQLNDHRFANKCALIILIAIVVLVASSAVGDSQGGDEFAASSAESNTMSRGKYMTALLGCEGCHTEGALEGNPYGPTLAGSTIGIAFTDSENGASPGIVFPGNLTPDRATGLGRWDRDEIVAAIRTGVSHSEEQLSSVMPWANYSLLTLEDTYEIADHLLSLPATRRRIPDSVAPGSANVYPFLRIGIYRFEPAPDSQPPNKGN